MTEEKAENADLEGRQRKAAIKRRNEQWKLTASSVDRLCTVILGGAVLAPIFQHKAQPVLESLAWLSVALAIHLLARYIIRQVEEED